MLIMEKLNNQNQMTDIEQTLADYFINIGRDLESISSRTIASNLYVAPSTVSRFCQLLGFSGFNEFKQAYLKELNYLESNFHDINPNFPFSAKDKNTRLASKMASLYKETVDDTLNLLQHDSLQKATRYLLDASIIYFGMIGDAYEMAETFKNRMIKIGRTVIVERRNDNLFFAACHAPIDSCFILISYSGETQSLLKVADKLKRRGINTVILTSYGDNSLSKQFETVISLSTREKLVENIGNFSSLISISFLLDVLYGCIFNENRIENFDKKIQVSREFEEKRKSDNPIIKDRM